MKEEGGKNLFLLSLKHWTVDQELLQESFWGHVIPGKELSVILNMMSSYMMEVAK